MINGVTGIIAGTAATAIAAVTLDGSSLSIELAGGLMVTVAGIVWWMSSKFTKLDDNLTTLRKEMREVKNVLKNCPAARKVDCETED